MTALKFVVNLVATLGTGCLPCREARSRSLVINTSLTMLLVGVGLSIFFAICSLPVVIGMERDRQVGHIEDLLSTVESTVRIACYVGDKALAEEIVHGLMTNHSVAAVRISTMQQVLVEGGAEASATTGNQVVTHRITSPFDPTEEVGRIELTANSSFIESQASSYSAMAVVILLAEALVVAFVVALVVLRTIIRPIKIFSHDLHKGLRLQPGMRNEKNEIGALARDVNAMMDHQRHLLAREKAMLAEVALSERRLRTLLDNSPDIVIRYDLNCRRVFVNPAFARETGIPIEMALDWEIEGDRTWRPTMPQHEYHQRLRSVMQTGRSEQMLLEWAGEDGNLVSHEMLVVAEHNAEGHTVGALAIGRNVTERKAIEQQLLHQATHDALTGLPNRTLLKDRLEQSLARAQRQAEGMAVIFLDLDNFKGINDTLGHEVGDDLLKVVANRMRRMLREEDTVARFGGDEFVIVLPGDLSLQGQDSVVKRMFDAISAPCIVGPHTLYPGASMGVAVFPQDGSTSDVLMRNADTAMYVAKEQGRNCYRFFSADMNDDLSEWMALGAALRHALDRNEFELYYQPKTGAAHGRLVGLEALIRWHHPERGLVPPIHFIPLAEESGMIVALGEWVVREACRQHREWLDAGLAPVKIAINLSPLQCQNEDFIDHVERALQRYRVHPMWLEVEVTESAAMSERSIKMLGRLRDLGVQIAMDDFGTGYSSLSNVKRLPISCLKIDRSFVSEIEGSSSDVQIVNAIVAMAHSLGLNVCAEGVETREQLDVLRDLGCDQIQGYFLSKPVTAPLIADMMRERDVWH